MDVVRVGHHRDFGAQEVNCKVCGDTTSSNLTFEYGQLIIKFPMCAGCYVDIEQKVMDRIMNPQGDDSIRELVGA